MNHVHACINQNPCGSTKEYITRIPYLNYVSGVVVHVKSFCDSNGDGIGDLKGITSKLDYLKLLGVDVLWMTPIYQSPNDDNGYDISSYYDIQKEFGTMEDFDELLREAHQRGIRIILDIVLNHTSDEHPWFVESRKDRNNPYRDYYIWMDPKDGHEPNNWTSCFQGPAWEYDQTSGQYYLHLFSKKQPDLNWQNPDVRQACYDIMNFWVDKGIDGFRLDVINLISKDPSAYTVDSDIKGHQVAANGPHIHEYLREMNQKVHRFSSLLTVGETPAVTVEDGKKYAPLDQSELSMIFQFELMNVDGAEENKWTDRRYELVDFKKILSRWQTGMHGHATNSLFLNNHDQPRLVSRFGDVSTPLTHEKSAKLFAAIMHMAEGVPYVYQGEELGMTNVPFPSLSSYRDIETFNTYHQLVEVEKSVSADDMLRYMHKSSRDNVRTPMQWNGEKNAGFTEGEPWIMVNPNYPEINAEKEVADENSIFHTYQRLIEIRKKEPLVVEGAYELLYEDDPDLFIYRRYDEKEELVICANISQEMHTYDSGLIHEDSCVLYGNYDQPLRGTLRPYECVVYKQSK